jgi:hypothetical protein
MNTEAETIRKLKRSDFATTLNAMRNRMGMVTTTYKTYDQVLKEHHWTEEEYKIACNRVYGAL